MVNKKYLINNKVNTLMTETKYRDKLSCYTYDSDYMLRVMTVMQRTYGFRMKTNIWSCFCYRHSCLTFSSRRRHPHFRQSILVHVTEDEHTSLNSQKNEQRICKREREEGYRTIPHATRRRNIWSTIQSWCSHIR